MRIPQSGDFFAKKTSIKLVYSKICRHLREECDRVLYLVNTNKQEDVQLWES